LKDSGLKERDPARLHREVTIFQRRSGKPGDRLGKTTGWILRNQLKRRGLKAFADCQYLAIDDDGLHVAIDGERRVFPVDTIVICAGQDSNSELAEALAATGARYSIIGGAEKAAELDARRAIDQGTRLGNAL
jgi:2,4-dienoyl-CoA reductase (NADPH2)